MEASRAVSSGVDRTIKVWDLGRGFCKNGFLCVAATYLKTVRATAANTVRLAVGICKPSMPQWSDSVIFRRQQRE